MPGPGEGATGFDRTALLEAAIRRKAARGISAGTGAASAAPEPAPRTEPTEGPYNPMSSSDEIEILAIDIQNGTMETTIGIVELSPLARAAMGKIAVDAIGEFLLDKIGRLSSGLNVGLVDDALTAAGVPAAPSTEKSKGRKE